MAVTDDVYEPEPEGLGDPIPEPGALATREALEHLADLIMAAEGAAEDSAAQSAVALQREHFRIDNDRAAEWAMRRLVEADEQERAVRVQADEFRRPVVERLDRINDWEQRAARKPVATRRFMEGLLEDYARRRRLADPRAATLDLPSGKVKTTNRKAAVRVPADPGQVRRLIEWLRTNLPAEQVAEVVKQPDPTVAARPLGDVAKPERRLVGVTYVAGLQCGHDAVVQHDNDGTDGWDQPAPRLGDSVVCPDCDVLAHVVDLGRDDRYVWVAVDDAGREVPADVVPPRLDVKVEPGG